MKEKVDLTEVGKAKAKANDFNVLSTQCVPVARLVVIVTVETLRK